MKQVKAAVTGYSWTVITQNHRSYHMADGLFQFVLLIVTKQGQCASAGKAQNTQIVQWLRDVGFKWSKGVGIVFALLLYSLFCKHLSIYTTSKEAPLICACVCGCGCVCGCVCFCQPNPSSWKIRLWWWYMFPPKFCFPFKPILSCYYEYNSDDYC